MKILDWLRTDGRADRLIGASTRLSLAFVALSMIAGLPAAYFFHTPMVVMLFLLASILSLAAGCPVENFAFYYNLERDR